MAQKIVISKPTFDAKTETDPDNLIFSSDYDSLKYYASGSVDLEVDGANVEGYITHDLGYVPFFIVYVNYIPLSTDYSTVPFRFADMGVYYHCNAYATTSRIYFTVLASDAVVTQTFVYKIFRNNTGL